MHQNCVILKIYYCGVLNYVTCEKTITYEDLQKVVAEKFQVPIESGNMIEFCDSHGYVIDWQTIQNILETTEILTDIFYIRINFDNNNNSSNDSQHLNTPTRRRQHQQQYSRNNNNTIKPFSYSKCNNRVKKYGSPLRRQNCFIGELPSPSNIIETKIPHVCLLKLKKNSKSIRI